MSPCAYLPTGHWMQGPWIWFILVVYVLFAHVIHADACCCGWNPLTSLQFVHLACRSRLNVPGAQTRQGSLDPTSLINFPTSHERQDDCPIIWLYAPCGHGSHAWPSALAAPSGHSKQLLSDVAPQKNVDFPAAQLKHTLIPDAFAYFPPGHAAQWAFNVVYGVVFVYCIPKTPKVPSVNLPAIQSKHTSWPCLLVVWYCPGWQEYAKWNACNTLAIIHHAFIPFLSIEYFIYETCSIQKFYLLASITVMSCDTPNTFHTSNVRGLCVHEWHALFVKVGII